MVFTHTCDLRMGVLNTWGMGLFSLIAQKHLLVLTSSWRAWVLESSLCLLLQTSYKRAELTFSFHQTRWIPWPSPEPPITIQMKLHENTINQHHITIFYHILPYCYPFVCCHVQLASSGIHSRSITTGRRRCTCSPRWKFCDAQSLQRTQQAL